MIDFGGGLGMKRIYRNTITGKIHITNIFENAPHLEEIPLEKFSADKIEKEISKLESKIETLKELLSLLKEMINGG